MKSIIMSSYLMCMAVMDLKEKKLPGFFLVVGSIMAFLVNIFSLLHTNDIGWEVISFCLKVLPGTCIIVIAKLTNKIGVGDGWLLLIIGMVTGYKTCMFILGISLFLSSLFSAVMLIFRRANRNTRFPYVPFLAVSYFLLVVL